MLAFRRPKSAVEETPLKLHGLTPNGVYEFTDVDTQTTTTAVGRDILKKGLPVVIKKKTGCGRD